MVRRVVSFFKRQPYLNMTYFSVLSNSNMPPRGATYIYIYIWSLQKKLQGQANSTEMWIVQTFLPTVGVVYIISNEAGLKMKLVETFSLVTRETDGKKNIVKENAG
jgi:hypothetical protein